VSWDLFTAAARESMESESRNAELARQVAARQADAGFPAPAIPRRSSMTVSEVNAAARELVEGHFPAMWVSGEVTNFTKARSGHCYFTLRDRDAQIRCVMWRDDARRLPTQPAEGMEVKALGRLTLYEQRGEFQLSVAELEARGEGLWKLAFQRLHTTLEAEGLTSPLRKRAIPKHPACVGIVTSSAGAALHDVVTVIRRRAPWTRIVLSAARVQGEGAAAEIAEAIRRVGRAGCVDVLIVGRGGGSVEDLWAFNEEAVARAIAESPVPVISAVGHETDVTIADLVADLRAPTPSAAAEAAVPDGSRVRAELAALSVRLSTGMQTRTAAARRLVERTADDLAAAADEAVRRRRDALAASAGRLNALSPLAALSRGFAVPLAADGRVLRRVADFPPGAAFRLRVGDGTVPAVAGDGGEADAQPRDAGR
jgi:exodeoxyribonuclease VII large subunit